MNIASIAQASSAAVPSRMPETKEAAGPDRDGDQDDKSVKSAVAKGVGTKVDITA